MINNGPRFVRHSVFRGTMRGMADTPERWQLPERFDRVPLSVRRDFEALIDQHVRVLERRDGNGDD